jgi:hypothetical protein
VTARLPANGRGVARRLVRALVEAALLDDRAAGSAELVRRIGAMDREEGFGPEHYPATTQMLLHAVRGVYRGEWTSTLSSAWVEYLLWLREQLVAGSTGDASLPGASAAGADRSSQDDAAEGDLDDDLDDDEEPPAYGELMVSMTQASRRDRERRNRRGR